MTFPQNVIRSQTENVIAAGKAGVNTTPVLENNAWGAYRTEFYPTYDYKAIGIAAHDKAPAQ